MPLFFYVLRKSNQDWINKWGTSSDYSMLESKNYFFGIFWKHFFIQVVFSTFGTYPIKKSFMKNKRDQKEIFQNLVNLAQISTINGMIFGDDRSIFLGETIKVVLGASIEEKHARLLQSYIQKFLNHVSLMEGQLKVIDMLKDESCAN